MDIDLLIKAVQDYGFSKDRHDNITFLDLYKILVHYRGIKRAKDRTYEQFMARLEAETQTETNNT